MESFQECRFNDLYQEFPAKRRPPSKVGQCDWVIKKEGAEAPSFHIHSEKRFHQPFFLDGGASFTRS